MKNLYHYLLIIGCIFSSPASNLLRAAFEPTTLISTARGPHALQNISFTTPITNYDVRSNSLTASKLKCLWIRFASRIIVITTNLGTIRCSPAQPFYIINQDCFVAAKNLEAHDVLLTQDGAPCICLNVSPTHAFTTMYDLSLDEPHTFFATDARVLAHNLTLGSGAALHGAGLEALNATMYARNMPMTTTPRPPSPIRTLNAAPPAFVSSTNSNKPFSFHATGETRQHARLMTDGSVEVVEQLQCTHQESPTTTILMWQDVRTIHTIRRDYPQAQEFLKKIDQENLTTIRTAIASWPASLTHYFDCQFGAILDKNTDRNDAHAHLSLRFVDATFTPMALYWMSENNIPPSKVLHAMAYGEPCSYRLWRHKQKVAIDCNVRVLFRPSSKTIVNVGQSRDILECSTTSDEARNFFANGHLKREARAAEKARIAELERLAEEQAAATRQLALEKENIPEEEPKPEEVQEKSIENTPEPPQNDGPEEPDPQDSKETAEIEKRKSTASNKENFERQSDSELQRSKSSHQKLLAEHIDKLQSYKENPLAHDNNGRLKNAPSKEIQQKIIQGRIDQLEKQIRRQTNDLELIEDIIKQRLGK